ncbi:hypothetical protein ARMSODRAFT_1016800 [Armillaria solidipes]|uniref:Uncharacterized protein n=1 Tax=Armillaria solidipes TaxID=1076256 RepID=A0A2H3C942_9AGAR|nr:hypothetical protein ARMSODRAFT_1016800 [Armillaria solidipes]
MLASHSDPSLEFTAAELTEINADPNVNDDNESSVSPSPGADIVSMPTPVPSAKSHHPHLTHHIYMLPPEGWTTRLNPFSLPAPVTDDTDKEC